jgi:phosphate transport system permease protein
MTVTDSSTADRLAQPPAFQHVSGVRKAKNWVATGLVTLAFAIAIVPLIWLLVTVIGKGFDAIVSEGWWTKSLKGVLPEEFRGGVYHALYGTFVQGLVCAVIAVPLGIMAAVYLVEYGRGRLARVTTFMVDILSGVPSIVAALFVFALWISVLGFTQSAFAVSLALVLLMLPVVVRSTEEMLRLVPDELREASYALGIPKWKTILRIVLPTALSGIVTGIMLAMARVMGETAPVLVLVGYSRAINFDVFDGNMASLPLLIYTELGNPESAGVERVWGAALTLIIVIMFFNLLAALISRFSAIKTK